MIKKKMVYAIKRFACKDYDGEIPIKNDINLLLVYDIGDVMPGEIVEDSVIYAFLTMARETSDGLKGRIDPYSYDLSVYYQVDIFEPDK